MKTIEIIWNRLEILNNEFDGFYLVNLSAVYILP